VSGYYFNNQVRQTLGVKEILPIVGGYTTAHPQHLIVSQKKLSYSHKDKRI